MGKSLYRPWGVRIRHPGKNTSVLFPGSLKTQKGSQQLSLPTVETEKGPSVFSTKEEWGLSVCILASADGNEGL